MNVYDSAHRLARDVKESDALADYKRAKEKLNGSTHLKQAFEDFKKRESELRLLILKGEEPEEKAIETLNELYGILARDPLGAEYFNAENRYHQMVEDLTKILADALNI